MIENKAKDILLKSKNIENKELGSYQGGFKCPNCQSHLVPEDKRSKTLINLAVITALNTPIAEGEQSLSERHS